MVPGQEALSQPGMQAMPAARTPNDFVWRPLPHEKEAFGLLARMALAAEVGATGLTLITPEKDPALSQIIQVVSARSGIPAPKTYYLEAQKSIPNAFANVGKVPCMVYTRPITQILNPEEIAAVTAHELGHTKDTKAFNEAANWAGIGSAAAALFATLPIRKWIRGDKSLGIQLSPADSGRKFAKFSRNTTALAVGAATAWTAARIGTSAVTRLEETSADRHTAIVMNDANETALMSALLKVSGNFPQPEPPTTWQKVKYTLFKPYYEAIQTHPTIPQRAADMGVTVEQVQAFQTLHAMDPTIAQLEPVMAAHPAAPAANSHEPGLVQSFVGKLAARASSMHSFGHETNWAGSITESRASAAAQHHLKR